jgi:hypothetical protein
MAQNDRGASPGLIPLPTTPGELLDRIMILRIRTARATSPALNVAARQALERAEAAWAGATIDAELTDLAEALGLVNQALWEAEDDIRDCERRGELGDAFIAAARAIVRLNDRRAELKREISTRCGVACMSDVKTYG